MGERLKQARDLAAEMYRLSTLTGNCGRVIARFLERTVEEGELDVRFDVPRNWHQLDLACFVATMTEEIDRLREAGASFGGPDTFLRAVTVFPWLSTGMVSYVVQLGDVPVGTGDRREMLRSLSETLEAVMVAQEGWLVEDAWKGLRAWYLGEDFVVTHEHLGVFQDVVRGVYTRLSDLPQPMVALAYRLDAQVAQALPDGFDVTLVAAGSEAESLEPA